MTPADAGDVYQMSSGAIYATAEEQVEWRKERYRYFLENDHEGAWVAVDEDRIAGVALALVRKGALPVRGRRAVPQRRGGSEVARPRSRLRRGAMIASSHVTTLMAGGTVRRARPDLEFMLRTGHHLLVAESPAGRGYAVVWD